MVCVLFRFFFLILAFASALCVKACLHCNDSETPLNLILSPLPILNQHIRNAIAASVTFKHINPIKHSSNGTHARLLDHAAQIARTIEDIKSYLSTRAILYPPEVSQMSMLR